MKTVKKRRGAPNKPVTASKRFDMRITEEQHGRWSAAALRDGFKSVSAWVKSLADRNA